MWIAIVLMIVLCGVTLAAAASTDEDPCPNPDIKTVRDACEKACIMPNGLIDLSCYENCVEDVCRHGF